MDIRDEREMQQKARDGIVLIFLASDAGGDARVLRSPTQPVSCTRGRCRGELKGSDGLR